MSGERFVLTPGPGLAGHTQPRVQLHGLTKEQCRTVRGVVCNGYMKSEDYVLKYPAGPFLQGYQEPCGDDEKDGWVLVEFWSRDMQAIQQFVDHLNQRVFDGKPWSLSASSQHLPQESEE